MCVYDITLCVSVVSLTAADMDKIFADVTLPLESLKTAMGQWRILDLGAGSGLCGRGNILL